jgi:hypothetical protein
MKVQGDGDVAGHFIEQAARVSGEAAISSMEGAAEEAGRGRVRTGDVGVLTGRVWRSLELERRRWSPCT